MTILSKSQQDEEFVKTLFVKISYIQLPEEEIKFWLLEKLKIRREMSIERERTRIKEELKKEFCKRCGLFPCKESFKKECREMVVIDEVCK